MWRLNLRVYSPKFDIVLVKRDSLLSKFRSQCSRRVKVVEEEKKTCGGNNVQISTRLLTRGWCVMATGTRTRGLWTAAWDTEVLCSEKTQKLCVHTSTSTAFRNHAIQKVFRVFKVIHIYYIHIYLSFFNLLLPSGVTSFRERYHRESSLGPLCFFPLLLSCAHFFGVGEARSRCKYTNLWLVATVMWVGRRERAVQESV